MISAFNMTAYAEPENQVSLDYQINAIETFKLYISESDNVAGELITEGNDYTKIFSGSINLKPGKTYYLHIQAYSSRITPRINGKFIINGEAFKFNNNSKVLLTNPDDFKAYRDTFDGAKIIIDYQTSHDYFVPGTKDIGMSTINGHQNTVCFSTPIIATPFLAVDAKSVAGSVNLAWNSFPGAISYSVERSSTQGGPYTQIATDLTETSYTDNSVTANTTYYYIVKAKLSDSETVTSSEVSGTPSTEIPAVDSKLKVVLEPEEKLQLSVDDHLDENTNMTWTSSDSTVAQVDANGVVTAIKAGNAVIHVQSPDGNYSDDINILVVDNADDYRLAVDLKVGKTSRLTVDDLTNTLNVTWDSSDATVATVSSKGVVTAKGKGLTLAKATDRDGNVVGQVYVRVRE